MRQLLFEDFLPKVDWKAPKVSDLPSWAGAKRIGFDVETKDPQLKELGPGNFRPGNHIVGIGFCIEDGPKHYLPIRHEGGDNMDVEHVLNYVRDQAKEYSGAIVGSNLPYDLGFCENEKILFPKVENFWDVGNAAVLIYELHLKYGLHTIAERYGLPGKDERVLREFAAAYKVNPKTELYKLPGRAVADYGMRDVELPLAVLRKQEREIEDLGIGDIWKLETDVLPILVKMRRRGVRVNCDKVKKVIQFANAQAAQQLAHVAHLSGVQLNIADVWNAAAMAMPLKAAGINVPATAKGKDSINKPLLKQCGPIGAALMRARDYSKLIQFADRTLKYQINGRVHNVFHQLRNTKEGNSERDDDEKGARYGRFSAEHYNVQQEPARDDEFGDMWRDIYEPEEGEFWLCSDWSQQEPRIAVHYAEILGLPGAKEFAERYRQDPTLDCHQMLADLTGIQRKIVKNYFNGAIYGMGDAKLCTAIGHPTVWVQRWGKTVEVPGATGKVIIDQFRAMVQWVSGLTRKAGDRAQEVGHVWTALRRRCNFMKQRDGSKGYEKTHKAFSRIGQGSAADQMKATLVAADRAGIPIRLIVHDEFDLSCKDIKQAKLLQQLQMDTVKFNVPMLVDSEIGPSWGKCKKVSKLEKEGKLDEYLAELLN